MTAEEQIARRVSHRLEWSKEVQAYELHDENTSRLLTSDSRTWFDWLAEIASFSFKSQSGPNRPADTRYNVKPQKQGAMERANR